LGDADINRDHIESYAQPASYVKSLKLFADFHA